RRHDRRVGHVQPGGEHERRRRKCGGRGDKVDSVGHLLQDQESSNLYKPHCVHASTRSPLGRTSSSTTHGPAASNSCGVRFSAARSKSVPRKAYCTAGPLALKNHNGTS